MHHNVTQGPSFSNCAVATCPVFTTRPPQWAAPHSRSARRADSSYICHRRHVSPVLAPEQSLQQTQSAMTVQCYCALESDHVVKRPGQMKTHLRHFLLKSQCHLGSAISKRPVSPGNIFKPLDYQWSRYIKRQISNNMYIWRVCWQEEKTT